MKPCADVEPTGRLGLAAARARKDELRAEKVGVIVSGGKVDLQRFANLVAQADPR